MTEVDQKEPILESIDRVCRSAMLTDDPVVRFELLCSARGGLSALTRVLEEERSWIRDWLKEIDAYWKKIVELEGLILPELASLQQMLSDSHAGEGKTP